MEKSNDGTFYKIWVEIEEINDDEDKYEDAAEPEPLPETFATLDEALIARANLLANYSIPTWSVLLQYPEGDTYYDWVEALDANGAVKAARVHLREGNPDCDPEALTVLLVTKGHIAAELRKADVI